MFRTSGNGLTTCSERNGGRRKSARTVSRFMPVAILLTLVLSAVLAAPSAQASFRVEDFTAVAENADGTTATQAGSHPYAYTVKIDFSQTAPAHGEPELEGEVRDGHDALPPGLIGNPTVVPACPETLFETEAPDYTADCPNSSAIGTAVVWTAAGHRVADSFKLPIFNVVPPPGVPAAFGFLVPPGVPVLFTPHVREDGSYGLTIDSINTAQTVSVFGLTETIWGVPDASSHDRERGSCITENDSIEAVNEGHPESPEPLVSCAAKGSEEPYLTLPSSCSGPLLSTVTADSWQEPGAYLPDGEPDLADPAWSSLESLSSVDGVPAGLDGCNRVSFTPAISARPTTDQTTSPTGLEFNLDFTNEGLTNREGLSESEVKKAVVTLPEGFTVNPSAGAGLGACSQATYEAISLHGEAACPEDSKLGNVLIETPLLGSALHGSIYIAEPDKNPFGSLLAMYMVVKEVDTGIVIKAAGRIETNPETGQITTTFDNLPQLPFAHFQLSFHQGQTSPLVSPPACGTYNVTADLTPWSNLEANLRDTASFQVTSGTDGGPCPAGGTPPFKPTVIAGTGNNAAGSYSPFYLRISRQDNEQEITGFSTTLPPGLSGNLSGIPFCSEADIARARAQTGAEAEADPACPAASQIGRTIAEAGVGSVLAQTPGRLYLGGPLEGAPFSVVSITSAKVGPFDLGTVVVHLPLKIDPITAQVSVPPGAADQIPHIIDGIVIHLRTIRVYIDREQFIINPTSCEPMSVSATVIGSGANFASSADDQPATVSQRFQAADCASLPFHPVFKAFTKAAHTKKGGAYLHVAMESGFGQAGLREVHVELPKELPSELKTLQKACTEAQFVKNPAGCPAESIVGHATVHTPILPVPLEGPAYFVSHGGAQFPELVIVLQGYGVTVELKGETFIDKAGITSSTFKSTPDVPFSNFDLVLPMGSHSALAGEGNFCAENLTMPTRILAQSGSVLEQKTAIDVEGCKPEIRIVDHSVKGSHARIRVSVPSAGSLVASGPAIVRAVKRSAKAQTVTIGVTLGKHDRRVLERNPRERVNAKVKLRFVPKHGKALTAHVRLLMG
jgi:hypothetical protein